MATKRAADVSDPVEDQDVPDTDADDTDADDTDADDTENADGTAKRRTRTPMPFGRPFALTIKFHNDLNGEREKIVTSLLDVIRNAADGETLDVHRSTRGEPVENLQTWLIAPFGYDWPESSNKERGVRIPQGALAEALRKFAAKNDVSMEKAAEMFAEAFGISAETVETK